MAHGAPEDCAVAEAQLEIGPEATMPKAIDVVELTKKLLTFNTINPPGNEGGCARFLGELLRDSGFSLTYHELAEGRTSIIARRGHHLDGLNGSQRAKPICFTGHIDTVPLGAANWSVDPFTGDRKSVV